MDVASRRIGLKGYRAVLKAFTFMPYAALYDNQVLLLHGGIAKGLTEVGQLETLQRGQEDVEDVIAAQILWNDPREGVSGFVESDRGAGAYYFGEDVFNSFMERNKLSLLVRSHEPMPNGYRYLFKQRLLTVFSCRYYGVPPKAAALSGREVELVGLG
jgi:diadenosine tetraphosphatase ApaH/serine/threonine PP2A family protein phosphatase